MREFEEREQIVAKCIVCGGKNKVHTELLDPVTKKFVGYSLKCCVCGNFHTFFNEHESNGTTGIPEYIPGPQRCIMPHFCPHYDCKLRKHCGPCKPTNPKPHKPTVCEDKAVHIGKVVYNLEKCPKFL